VFWGFLLCPGQSGLPPVVPGPPPTPGNGPGWGDTTTSATACPTKDCSRKEEKGRANLHPGKFGTEATWVCELGGSRKAKGKDPTLVWGPNETRANHTDTPNKTLTSRIKHGEGKNDQYQANTSRVVGGLKNRNQRILDLGKKKIGVREWV